MKLLSECKINKEKQVQNAEYKTLNANTKMQIDKCI